MTEKTISIFSDYGERILSNSIRIAKLMDKIDIQGACFVKLDLSKCIIDYPNTASLIDHILKQLAAIDCEKKSLVIKCDFVPSEEITLNYLFVGSQFMGIEESKAYNLNDLKTIIRNIISKQEILLSFEEVSDSGEILQSISL